MTRYILELPWLNRFAITGSLGVATYNVVEQNWISALFWVISFVLQVIIGRFRIKQVRAKRRREAVLAWDELDRDTAALERQVGWKPSGLSMPRPKFDPTPSPPARIPRQRDRRSRPLDDPALFDDERRHDDTPG